MLLALKTLFKAVNCPVTTIPPANHLSPAIADAFTLRPVFLHYPAAAVREPFPGPMPAELDVPALGHWKAVHGFLCREGNTQFRPTVAARQNIVKLCSHSLADWLLRLTGIPRAEFARRQQNPCAYQLFSNSGPSQHRATMILQTGNSCACRTLLRMDLPTVCRLQKPFGREYWTL
jgi:hypothetical protein